jgi:hypothetical protein
MDLIKVIKKYSKDIGNICLKVTKNFNDLYVINNYDRETIILQVNNINKFEFVPIYIGSIDEKNNIWYWSFNSSTINKKYIELKEKLLAHLHQNLYKKEQTEKYINYIKNDMFNINNDRVNLITFITIVFNSKGYIGQRDYINPNIVHYYIVKYILVNNI